MLHWINRTGAHPTSKHFSSSHHCPQLKLLATPQLFRSDSKNKRFRDKRTRLRRRSARRRPTARRGRRLRAIDDGGSAWTRLALLCAYARPRRQNVSPDAGRPSITARRSATYRISGDFEWYTYATAAAAAAYLRPRTGWQIVRRWLAPSAGPSGRR